MAEGQWNRKIGRAEKHLADIKKELGKYERHHPYAAERDVDANSDPRVYVYRAKLTEQPREDFDLIIGDFMVNLRSALDHLIVNIKPVNRSRAFPVYTQDPWETDPNTGEHIKPEKVRSEFLGRLKDLTPEAIQIVKDFQPWNGSGVGIHALSFLNRMANSDKHKNALVVATGVFEPIAVMTLVPTPIKLTVQQAGKAENGARVCQFIFRKQWLMGLDGCTPAQADTIIATWKNREMEPEVEIRGTPVVGIDIGDGGVHEIPYTLDSLVSEVKTKVVAELERFT